MDPSRAARLEIHRRRASSVLALALLGAGCGEYDGYHRCEAQPPAVTAEGIRLTDDCRVIDVALLPAARVDETWVGGGRDGACAASGLTVTCPAGEVGEVSATLDGDTVHLALSAERDATLQGLALEGGGVLAGATGWLSNGFQSWSQSGVLALGARPGEQATLRAAGLRGDQESLRSGSEMSFWYTYVGGGAPTLFAGALDAERFRSWAQVNDDGAGGLLVRLVSGAGGEQVDVAAGDVVAGEPWMLEAGYDLTDAMTRYGQRLPSRRQSVAVDADVGWNSWYELWNGVDATAVRENAALAADWLAPYAPADAPLRIVVDDGWQQAWGEWEPNAKFPEGLDGLAAELHGQGFEVGVWLAPVLVTADSSLVADHPDWFLPEATYPHLSMGEMRILDVTHPEAADHLSQLIARIVSWGYDFLKIDFLFAGSYESPRYEQVTGMQAYHRALELIRAAAGEDVILLAVGAPPLPSFPHVDAWRVGGDIALQAFGVSWHFAVNQARSIAARWPLCHATLCDADPPILRALSEVEVGFGGWVVALSGGGLFLSDDLRALDGARVGWALSGPRAAASVGGVPASPLDPVPAALPGRLSNHTEDFFTGENSHVLPVRYRLPDGSRVQLNLTESPLEVEGVTIPARGAAVVP